MFPAWLNQTGTAGAAGYFSSLSLGEVFLLASPPAKSGDSWQTDFRGQEQDRFLLQTSSGHALNPDGTLRHLRLCGKTWFRENTILCNNR